jgi:4-nitrophenyl phosphatase
MIEPRDLQGWVIDMDGVLWRGETPLPGLQEFFGLLGDRKLGFILATNNARQTAERVVAKLASFGVSIRPEQVLTSSVGAAAHLQSQLPAGSPVFAIGEQGLIEALEAAGFPVVPTAEGARAVVVGIDSELSWKKLAEAAYALQNGALFLGTNPDVSFPTERGEAPGNGATLAALTATTGRQPMVFGKPEPHLFRQALARLGTPPERTAALGDRLETDILGGSRAGLRTILVLTGVTSRSDLAGAEVQPDWVFEDLVELWRALQG